MWIDNGDCVRQSFALLMVVCNHHVNSERTRVSDLDSSRDAVIDGYDKIYVVFMEDIDCAAVETVSLALAVGNVVHHICARRFEIGI